MISRIRHVSVPVSNQERALSFYTEVLGFEVVTDEPQDDGSRWIELRLPSTETSVVLFEVDASSFQGHPSNVVYGTDDIYKTYRMLDEHGVSFTQPVVETHWGAYARFLDPEGNEFVLAMDDT